MPNTQLSSISCHVGRTYAGAFGYADEMALLAPSLNGLKRMINMCDDYPEECQILFNLSKCYTIVDIADLEKHLRNKLFDNIYKRDIKGLVGDIYKRNNAVIGNFNMCESQTLDRLHSVFCIIRYICVFDKSY